MLTNNKIQPFSSQQTEKNFTEYFDSSKLVNPDDFKNNMTTDVRIANLLYFFFHSLLPP